MPPQLSSSAFPGAVRGFGGVVCGAEMMGASARVPSISPQSVLHGQCKGSASGGGRGSALKELRSWWGEKSKTFRLVSLCGPAAPPVRPIIKPEIEFRGGFAQATRVPRFSPPPKPQLRIPKQCSRPRRRQKQRRERTAAEVELATSFLTTLVEKGGPGRRWGTLMLCHGSGPNPPRF